MSLLPPNLQAYEPIISVALLFVDGLLFGIAAKKAVMSIVLIMVAILLAGFVGLSIPFMSSADVLTHLEDIFAYQLNHIGPIFATFPIFWIVGFAIGIWRG
jgi:hypothetical protein